MEKFLKILDTKSDGTARIILGARSVRKTFLSLAFLAQDPMKRGLGLGDSDDVKKKYDSDLYMIVVFLFSINPKSTSLKIISNIFMDNSSGILRRKISIFVGKTFFPT